MNATTGDAEGVLSRDDALPDVTQIPLLELAPEGNRVLDAAIHRLVEDIVEDRETTAGFGNIP